ncbi:hypothetical protein AMECASPLE_013377, partial [Ameca splendens]
VALFVGLLGNIHGAKRREEALRQKEGNAYSLSKNHRNTSLESIFYHSTHTHILIFNPAETESAIFHLRESVRRNVVSHLEYGSLSYLQVHLQLKLFTRALGI